MDNYIYLSHFMNSGTPAYGGDQNIKVSEATSIAKGRSNNSKYLEMSNHVGTHVDFPRHFSDKGKAVNDYPPDFWIFDHPYIVEVSADDDQIILLEGEIDHIPVDTDFLIIKTDFQRYRGQKKYWNNNPGLHPRLASDLRQKCSSLRIVGFDLVSLTAYQNRELGRIAHKSFLVENDLLVIEDMDLSHLEKSISRIICLPLLIDEIDGAPITIIGKI